MQLDGLAIGIEAPEPGGDIIISWENDEPMHLTPSNALLIAYALIAATDDHE